MTLPGFFLARRDCRSCYIFGYAQFNNQQGGFIVPLTTGISTELDVVGQYDVICKAIFDPCLSILAFKRSLQVDWDIYISVEHPFLRKDFPTGDILSLLPSRVAKLLRSGSEKIISIPGCDVMWLRGLAYA